MTRRRSLKGCAHVSQCRKPANVLIDGVPYCPAHAVGVLLAVYNVHARPIGERLEVVKDK